jgi:hypothetical protein
MIAEMVSLAGLERALRPVLDGAGRWVDQVAHAIAVPH